ncbi:MAG: protein translocase subunit SecF [Coriobacteriia bacterium]
MRKVYIDFMGNRNRLFIASGVIIAVGIGALLLRGLLFGIEFKGGTVMTFNRAPGVSISQVRAELRKAGVPDSGNALIQSTQDGGYIVRTAEVDADKASTAYTKVATDLKLAQKDGDVTTIGPGWGKNITNKALIALALSMAAILVYISFRFEYKMSVTAVIALVHDALITLGVYALVGREVTPNTVAALLTILGYSLYDTIVVFHRIRENSQRITKQTFMQMANDSINQVLIRWINTGLSSLIPVVVLLIFGGSTLKDFAFALTVGLVSGAYSSVAIAAPLYAMWKEREPRFRALAKKLAKA